MTTDLSDDIEAVRRVCEEHGYGFTIAFASAMWANKQWGPAAMAEWLTSLAQTIGDRSAVEFRWLEAQ